MAEKIKWRYCVVGNIIKQHIDKNGVLRYGTSAFAGGTKVYLCGKHWDEPRDEITVIGFSRGKRYQISDVALDLIENIRCSREYKPSILLFMDDFEFHEGWWDDSMEDKRSAEAFIKMISV